MMLFLISALCGCPYFHVKRSFPKEKTDWVSPITFPKEAEFLPSLREEWDLISYLNCLDKVLEDREGMIFGRIRSYLLSNIAQVRW